MWRYYFQASVWNMHYDFVLQIFNIEMVYYIYIQLHFATWIGLHSHTYCSNIVNKKRCTQYIHTNSYRVYIVMSQWHIHKRGFTLWCHNGILSKITIIMLPRPCIHVLRFTFSISTCSGLYEIYVRVLLRFKLLTTGLAWPW